MLMDAQADAALDASPDGDAALPDAGTPDATVCTDGVVTIQPVELDGHMRSMPEWPAVFASCPAAGSTEAEVRVYRGRPPELIFEGTLPCDDTGIRLPPLPAGSYMVAVRATSSVTRGVYIAGWIGRWCTEITRCASPVIDPCAALCVRVPDSCEPVQVSARLECSNAESRIRDLCFYP